MRGLEVLICRTGICVTVIRISGQRAEKRGYILSVKIASATVVYLYNYARFLKCPNKIIG